MADRGEGPPSPPPLCFLDQTEARRTEEKILRPPPPLPPPPLSQGLAGRSGSATEQTRKMKKERGHYPAISSSSP